MADFTSIQQSIYEHAMGDEVFSDLVTGVYDTMAPPGATYPYLVLSIIDTPDSWDREAVMTTARIQADVYDGSDDGEPLSSKNAELIMKALDAAFSYATIRDPTGVYNDGTMVPMDTRKLKEAPDVWRISRDYQVLLHRISDR